MDADRFNEMVKIVREKGPHRVLASGEGDAMPVSRAKERGVTWDVVFLRRDGWTLGASYALAREAERTWLGEWQAKLDVASGVVTPY